MSAEIRKLDTSGYLRKRRPSIEDPTAPVFAAVETVAKKTDLFMAYAALGLGAATMRVNVLSVLSGRSETAREARAMGCYYALTAFPMSARRVAETGVFSLTFQGVIRARDQALAMLEDNTDLNEIVDDILDRIGSSVRALDE